MPLGTPRLATVLPNDQLAPVDFVTPGFRGLNTVQASGLMDPGFCVSASNAVIDTSARLASRQGANTLTQVIPITFTAPPTGTSATLTAAFIGVTGVYLITFSDAEIRLVTLTNGLTTATWATALTGTPGVATSAIGAVRQTITFTVPPTGQSGTLNTNWTQATGIYTVWFSNGISRPITLTNGATTATWSSPLTGSPAATALVMFSILSIFEYNQGANVYQQIIAWPGGISNSAANPLGNSIAGSVNTANGRWFFQNFNNKCIGFQAGQKPIVYTGSGNFAPVIESAGTAPSGGVGCAAFGRIWAVQSDLQTIQYSGLLDETDWSLTDGNAGLIDMHTIWSDGTDSVTAIFAFNAALVVCGTKHIVFFTDGRGSMLGMDPTQAYVFDMLAGTGCISQWTVDHIGEADVVFLAPNGVQSLLRLTQNRNNPIETQSKYNRDTLLGQIQQETPSLISGVFNALTGFYILGLPNSGVTWCFDQRRKFIDDVGEQCAITTTWTMALTACADLVTTQALFLARSGMGTVCNYSGFTDEGTPYQFQYVSPWMNLGQQVAQRLKMLKRLSLILFTAGSIQFGVTWAVDFSANLGSTTQTVSSFGTSSQYGIGQYGLAQYGGGTNLYSWKYAAHIKGQYFQISITTNSSAAFALQQMQFAAKIGRIA
jgi:hypothetical protein